MELRQCNPWPELFREARRSAFHLEVRDSYAVPRESEPLRRFLSGEPRINQPDEPWLAWSALIQEAITRGATVSRVRVVTIPHSDYQRWLLAETADNIELGEDIRYIDRASVGNEEVPQDDFWLFDDEKVGFNLVDPEGKPAGAAITVDPGIVAYCRGVKENLWARATPYAEYVAVGE